MAFAIDEKTCIDLINAGDYERVIRLGEELIQKNPKSFLAYACLSRGYYEIGDFKKSLEHAKKMEELAKDKKELSLAYNRLGLAYRRLGDLDLALMYHNRELSLSRELGDKSGEATALNNIAGIYKDKGDYKKALEFYEQSLKLTDDPKDRAPTLNNIGLLYEKLGDYQKAVKNLKKAIEIAERVGDYHGAGRRMLNLGNIYRKMKEYPEAERYLSEGLIRIQKTGDKDREAHGYRCFGDYYLDTALYERALESFYRAYSIEKRFGYNTFESLVGMAISLELKPELREKLEKLSGKDQKLFVEIEEAKRTPEAKELIAKYKRDQEAKDQQAPKKEKAFKREEAQTSKSSKPKSQTPAKDPQKEERKL